MVDDEKPKPQSHLRLVAENSPRAMSEEQARLYLIRPFEELAANILRIVRGAGKPYRLLDECIEVVQACQEYRDKTGHWPRSDQVAEILDLETSLRHEPTERDHALNRIARGSLQFVASRMLGQRPQEVAGEYEMSDGIRDLEAERERVRSELHSWKVRKKQRQSEPEEEIDLGPTPKKKPGDKISSKPAPRPMPQPTPPPKKADRKTPPNYDRCARYQMTEEERAEFRVNNVDDLVAIANDYLIKAGQWPLTQADFPGSKSGFNKVAKMVRAFQAKEAP